MLELVIDNSYSQIKGLQTGAFSRLRKALSYQVDAQAAFFAGGHKPRYKFMIDAKGFFPTGLLRRVIDFIIVDEKLDLRDVTDRRISPKSTHLFFGEWDTPAYPAQSEALIAARAQERGCISMPTGTGKSRVIAQIIEAFHVKTLVVVPSLEIKRQLSADLKAAFGSLKNIHVENIDSKALTTLTGIDCLIIDEAHHVAAATYQRLNRTAWKGVYHRFFMTATPFRNNTEETILFEGIAGNVIYELSYKEAIAKGYIVPVEAYYKELPKTPNDCYTWAETYSQLVVNNDYRNGYISGMLTGLEAKGVSTLCLVKEVKHGQILADLANVPFANGKDEESRKYIQQFNEGKIKVLIGTTGILGEGVDTKPCEYVIIAGLGKAKSALMQQIGRCVRRYPGKESGKVVLFRDTSHKFTTRHFRIQSKIIYTEYGIKPLKLDV